MVRRYSHSNTFSTGGFTLIEVLVSCLILAVGAMVINRLVSNCLTHTAQGALYAQSYRLLDEALNKAAAGNISQLAGQEVLEGNFQPNYPTFKYRIEITPEPTTNLFRVRAKVFWQDGGHDYESQLETLMTEFHRAHP